MKNRFAILLFSILVILSACEKEKGENEYSVSKNFDDESHNTGQNCMECHFSGGSGEGWFTLAGSVYDKQDKPLGNGVVKLTTEPESKGSIIATIEIDAKGNFFTTESIAFGNGLYATVESQEGTPKYMITKVTNGACNSCHGSSTSKIWVE